MNIAIVFSVFCPQHGVEPWQHENLTAGSCAWPVGHCDRGWLQQMGQSPFQHLAVLEWSECFCGCIPFGSNGEPSRSHRTRATPTTPRSQTQMLRWNFWRRSDGRVGTPNSPCCLDKATGQACDLPGQPGRKCVHPIG